MAQNKKNKKEPGNVAQWLRIRGFNPRYKILKSYINLVPSLAHFAAIILSKSHNLSIFQMKKLRLARKPRGRRCSETLQAFQVDSCGQLWPGMDSWRRLEVVWGAKEKS